MAKKVKNNSLFDKLENEKVKNQQETEEISAAVEPAKIENTKDLNVVDTNTFIGKLHSISDEDKEKLKNYDKLTKEIVQLNEEKTDLINKLDEYLSEIKNLKEQLAIVKNENNNYILKIQEISNSLAVKDEELKNKKIIKKKPNVVQSFNKMNSMTGYKSWN